MKRKLRSFRRKNKNFVLFRWFTSKEKKRRQKLEIFFFFFSKKEKKSHAISKTKDHRGFSSEIEEAQRNENFNLFFFFFWNEKQRWEIENSTRWKGERKMKGRKEKIISNATWKEKRNRNDLKSVILEKIEVVAVPRWIVRLVNRLRMGDARNMVYNVLVLKAGQDRLSGTERVSLKGEAWTLSELVRLFSGQLAAKSETCVARLPPTTLACSRGCTDLEMRQVHGDAGVVEFLVSSSMLLSMPQHCKRALRKRIIREISCTRRIRGWIYQYKNWKNRG